MNARERDKALPADLLGPIPNTMKVVSFQLKPLADCCIGYKLPLPQHWLWSKARSLTVFFALASFIVLASRVRRRGGLFLLSLRYAATSNEASRQQKQGLEKRQGKGGGRGGNFAVPRRYAAPRLAATPRHASRPAACQVHGKADT